MEYSHQRLVEIIFKANWYQEYVQTPAIKDVQVDLHGAPVVRNPPAHLGHRFDPWSRKFSHAGGSQACALQLLSPCTLEPMVCNRRNHCSEKPHHSSEGPVQPIFFFNLQTTNQKNDEIAISKNRKQESLIMFILSSNQGKMQIETTGR